MSIDVRRSQRRHLPSVCACLAVAVLTLTACSSGGSSPATSSPAAGGAPSGGAKTAAQGLVEAMAKSGFAVPNPKDTTATDCADIHCEQSIVTDTVTIRSFPTTGSAEIYAKPLGLDQVESIVVSYAPSVSESEQSRYWAEILKLLD